MRKTATVVLLLGVLAGPVWSSQALWLGGCTPHQTATYFYVLNGTNTGSGTITLRHFLCPAAGTVTKMTVWSAAPGAGKSWAFALYKNGSASAMTVTLGEAETTDSVTTDITFVAGDTLALEINPDGTPPSQAVYWCLEYTPTTANHSYHSGGGISLTTSGTYYLAPKGTMLSPGNYVHLVFPVAGTIHGLRIHLTVPPGAPESRTFTLWKSGNSTSSLCTIAGAAQTTDSDDANEVSIAAGDYVEVRATLTGDPNTAIATVALDFESATANAFPLFHVNGTGDLSASQAHYMEVDNQNPSDTTEAAHLLKLSVGLTLTTVYTKLTNTPDNGAGTQSYEFMVREDSADTSPALSCTIAETATTGNGSTSVSIEAGHTLGIECTPAGTPTATGRRPCVGVLASTSTSTAVPAILHHKRRQSQ